MKTYRQLIEELNLKVDNPGGQWLKDEQRYAEEDIDYTKQGHGSKGLNGSTTAYFREPVPIDMSILIKLEGVNNEKAIRHTSSKYKDLRKEVEAKGGYDHYQYPPMILVNHRGDGFISEGNHRIAVSHDLGETKIPVELKYFNGGEQADGPLHPSKIQ